jgi:hypothetical protein
LDGRAILPFILTVIFPILLMICPDDGIAQSRRYPISGTPLLREQKLLLLRNYGAAAGIKAEREQGRTIRADTLGQQTSFWAYNFGTGRYDQATATLKDVTQLSSGYYVYLYVENAELTRDPTIVNSLSNIRNEYINTILPTESRYFGDPPAGDFTILLMDIKDGGGGFYYVAGYFDSTNEMDVNNSNRRHMIYLDSREGTPGSISFNGTLAHEFQHYIHYGKDPYEEAWVEEGLSGLANYLCGYGHSESHVEAFAQAPTTSLTSWGGDLANYGATYLFMLYLNERYGGEETIKTIVANSGTGITGINSALSQRGYAVTVNDIFKNWVIANYLNDASISGGIYGYQASFSGITSSPGNIRISSTFSSYPQSGNRSLNHYAADYVKFTNLGSIYDIFVLIPSNLSESAVQFYSYTGELGSFILNLSGISSTLYMAGVQESTLNQKSVVISGLSAQNFLATSPPEGPSSLITTAISDSQINLKWTDNADNENGFILERKIGTSGTYVQIATLAANVNTYDDTGLNPSTTYDYQLKAYNSLGESAYSNEASATTFALNAVGGGSGSGSTSGGGGGGCFIATGAYGSSDGTEIQILRDFRDRILLNNPAGKAFVDFYYRTSPPIGKFVGSHEIIRVIVRGFLFPIVGISWLALELGIPATLVLIFLVCIIIAHSLRKMCMGVRGH